MPMGTRGKHSDQPRMCRSAAPISRPTPQRAEMPDGNAAKYVRSVGGRDVRRVRHETVANAHGGRYLAARQGISEWPLLPESLTRVLVLLRVRCGSI